MRKTSDILVDPHNTPEEVLKAAEQSLIKGFKSHVIDQYQVNDKIKPLKIRITHPNQDVELLIAEAYTKKYNELILDENMLVWDQLRKILNKRGVWTDKDEQDYLMSDIRLRDAALRFAMWSKQNDLDKKGRSSEEQSKFDSYKEEYDRVDEEISLLNLRRYGHHSRSIEGQANEYAGYYKFVYCILQKKGKEWVRLWETIKDFRDESPFNNGKIKELSSVAYAFWAGLTQEILDDLPDPSVGEDTKNVSKKS